MQNVTAARTLNRRLNLLTPHQCVSRGGGVKKEEEEEKEEEKKHVHAVHSQHTDTQTCSPETLLH